MSTFASLPSPPGRVVGFCIFDVGWPRYILLAVEEEGTIHLRIVIVEDNDDNRETLEELLRLEGHQVQSAADGIAGAALILRERPDLAFVDVGLPGIDGYGVARKIRSEGEDATPLVALTGYGAHEDKAATADAGFNRHLVKPVDPDALLRLIGEYDGAGASATA